MKNIFFALFFCYLSPAISQTFTDGFESGSISEDWRASNSGSTSETFSVVTTSQACNGTYSLKSKAVYPPDYRTELSLLTKNAPFKELYHDKEYWIGVAIFLPDNWEQDGKLGEILLQAHHRPDKHLGEPRGGKVPFALSTKQGQWHIRGLTNPEKLCASECQSSVIHEFIGSYEKNTWTEFVFNVKFTHTKSGFIKVWKNNELVVNYSGPIGYNDERGPWIKMGVYKAIWKYGKSIIPSRTVYHDDIRIKEGAGSRADVEPNCGNDNKLSPPVDLNITF